MKNKIFFFSLILFFIDHGFSFGQTTFQKTYDITSFDEGNFLQPTRDGGYIILGSNAGVFQVNQQDISLIKTDAYGNILWTKNFGDTIADFGYAVYQTSDGGYIIAGDSYNSVLLIKTDSVGDTLWTKTYGDTWADIGRAVLETFDGGIIVAGFTESAGNASNDIYLLKTNSTGDTLWTKTYGEVPHQEDAAFLQQTTDSGFIICGHSNFGGGNNIEAYLVKTDSLGILQWSKTYGGNDFESLAGVVQTFDGGFITVGNTNSYGAGNFDALVIKTDSNGEVMWSKSYGGAQNDVAESISQMPDSGYIICGYSLSFGGNAYLIRLNQFGDTLWTKAVGETSSVNGRVIYPTTDGGFILLGDIYYPATSNKDILLIKTDSTGSSNCYEYNTNTIVTVLPLSAIDPPTMVSAGGHLESSPIFVGTGGTGTTICFTDNVVSLELPEIVIAPNPATDQFAVRSLLPIANGMENGQIEIFNSLGQKISSATFMGQAIIDCRQFPKGFYFVRVCNSERQVIQKLIIE
jgi:hypothetical protein